jgi:hypothetical protein
MYSIFKTICNIIIITVSEIMSPEDEMQFWSNFANSVGRKDEKEKATAFWYALEPLVNDFRQALLFSLECRFLKNLFKYSYMCEGEILGTAKLHGNFQLLLETRLITYILTSFQNYLNFLHPVEYHVSKVYLGAVNTAIDYKPILQCLIFWLYFHPTTCFDL